MILTLIPFEFREPIKIIHLNVSVILRIFNCGQAIDTDKLDKVCKYTYEFIVVEFPWVNVTPSLHKVLAIVRSSSIAAMVDMV